MHLEGRMKQFDPEELASWLADHRFERLELVEAPGDFARRGDILDVFAPGENQACSDRVLRGYRRVDSALSI